MNQQFDNATPRFDVQLLFNEIGVALDDNQYRDVISLLDMYHVYIRQHQVSSLTGPKIVINLFFIVPQVSPK